MLCVADTPLELRDAGVNLIRQAGFSAAELIDAEYSIAELREAGFSAYALRQQLNLPIDKLRLAGYSFDHMRSCGFAPAELLRAGYPIKDVRAAGFTAAALNRKSGFSLLELKKFGYAASELKGIEGVTPQKLLELGYSKSQVQAAGYKPSDWHEPRSRSPSPPPPPPPDSPEGREKAQKEQKEAEKKKKEADKKKKSNFKLPEKYHIKAGLEALDSGLDGRCCANGDTTAQVVVGTTGRVYASRSLLLFRPSDIPRRWAIKAVESSYFEAIVLCTIGANVLSMACESPLDPLGTPKAHLLDVFEHIYLIIYTIELAIKVLAFGFLMHRHSYLRDTWCQLDFVVVSSAWLPLIWPDLPVQSMSALRSVRALRPLRALKRMPGMPQLVSALMNALPKLRDVLMLCGFVFLVGGIVGTELFKGVLHNRCAYEGFHETVGHPVAEEEATSAAHLAAVDVMHHTVSRMVKPHFQAEYDSGVTCREEGSWAEKPYCKGGGCGGEGMGGGGCSRDTTCSYFDEAPADNLVSFDDVPSSFIILLQAVTFDDWANSMYLLMGAYSPDVWIYFVLIAMIGGFFLVNLFLAVIFEEFLSTKRVEKAVASMERRRERLAIRTNSNVCNVRTPYSPPPTFKAEAAELKLLTLRATQTPPSSFRLGGGPQTARGRAQLLLAAAENEGDILDYLLEKRRLKSEKDVCPHGVMLSTI